MNADFLVIGGGMSGASVAAELSRHGSVLLLEQESQPGYHSTGRSAAAFIPSYGARCASLRSLTLASMAFFQLDADGAIDVPLLRRRGLITIGSTEEFRSAGQEREHVASLIPGHIHELSPAETQGHLPGLKLDWSTQAWFEPDVFDIEVAVAHQFYLKMLSANGGVVEANARVEEIQRQNSTWQVTTRKGEFQGSVLINAAGAWASEIGEMACAQTIALQPLQRTALCIDAPGQIDCQHFPLVLDHSGSFYMKPDAGQLLISLADEKPSVACDAQPDELDIAHAVHNVQQAFDFDVRRVNHAWAGLRTFSPDREPVIGFDACAEGFFWLAGHGGHGIQIAPATARLACALITHQPIPKDIDSSGFVCADVSPERFLNNAAAAV